MRPRYRYSAIAMAVVLACALAAMAEPTPSPSDETSDWLKFVPGDAHFYVELRDLASIRRQFQRLGIWTTVRDLTERTGSGATTQPWQRTTEEYLHLSSETAIHFFLGRRTALIATESGQWQNGVILAELLKGSDLRPWLRRWRANSLTDEGPVHRYELPGGILLAVADRTLAFGPAGDPEGLWGRTVLLLAGRRGPTLAGRSEFAALRSRLSASYPVVLYVVWPEHDPTAIQGCTRLLAGASVTESGITCELRGQRAAHEEAEPPLNVSVLRMLPASTVAVRAGSFDFDQLTDGAQGKVSPKDKTLLTLFLQGSFEDEKSSDETIADLGPGCVVVLGQDRPKETPGFDMPAVTAICQTRGGAIYVQRLDRTIQFLARLLARLTLPPEKTTEPISVEVTECEGVPLHHLRIGPILSARAGLTFLDGVDVCWALLDERLVLSSSLAQAEEIVRAARGKATTLADSSDVKELLPAADESSQVVEWWFARGSVVADMVSTWLAYLERKQPEAMRPEWWQEWASERLVRRTPLGIGLATDPNDPHRAVVKEVAGRSLAMRFLKVGDIVVGAAGSPLTTSQPAQEVADRYADRGDARVFPMQIIRGGRTMALRIPVPPTQELDLQGFDPVRSLKQLMTLSSHARTATVWRYAIAPDRFDARIQIHWEPVKTPTSQPAPKSPVPSTKRRPPGQLSLPTTAPHR
ncbi:MAG TPA: hypothetical protein VMV94_16155 [Phycisphaerae bacterium]|nr:hypothetical protein [Phycisphaerae bacterium]